MHYATRTLSYLLSYKSGYDHLKLHERYRIDSHEDRFHVTFKNLIISLIICTIRMIFHSRPSNYNLSLIIMTNDYAKYPHDTCRTRPKTETTRRTRDGRAGGARQRPPRCAVAVGLRCRVSVRGFVRRVLSSVFPAPPKILLFTTAEIQEACLFGGRGFETNVRRPRSRASARI